MFGYVKPLMGELKIREFELYKAFYCGLCRRMGRLSKLSKLALNYDIVFLALVRSLLFKAELKTKPFRCFVKPIKKRHSVIITEPETPDLMEYSSAAAIILTCYKYADDLSDTKNPLKKAALALPYPFFKSMLKKPARRCPEIAEHVKQSISRLKEAEKKIPPSPDLNASIFGSLMGFLFSYGVADEKLSAEAENFGVKIGQWIYLADALDDFKADLKSGAHNPFTAMCKSAEELAANLETIKSVLSCNLESALDSFAFFPEGAATPIVKNIVALGLCAEQERIIRNL